MLNRKDTIIRSIAGQLKKYMVYTSECFPKPNTFGANVKFELDLSNYATKTDLKNTTEVDTSKFVKRTGLAS